MRCVSDSRGIVRYTHRCHDHCGIYDMDQMDQELSCWNEKGDKMNGRLPHMVKKVNHYEPTPRYNEHFPIYDVGYFHPDSQSINVLSRDKISPIEGYYPNRVLPNPMTHCNYLTTAPSFDCIKYTPNKCREFFLVSRLKKEHLFNSR